MLLASSLNSLKLSNPFLHGTTLSKPSPTPPPPSLSRPSFMPPIRALKSMQGKVVCATNNKTIAVEVTRLAPHPKYKRRVRKKKKYQAHDEDNQFKVGDIVQLLKSRPISKTKAFVATPVQVRKKNKEKKEEGEGGEEGGSQELGIPLESEQGEVLQA
ncbi:30S ribosomal protein S17 chloroplastic [Tripterygium wilfordii]|uniref:Small ribosomal subunit protein uS17c n=1 Tax=Tripterygium wilfordii TaxID=458696 RepID=A0A7J7CYK3_TRIWF|nr:30S ribosomal protein S17, chloroplastic-like [Tripterygium wilfordii]KAF5739154.1 30S ribosomal protein S17 chloroplastic [Tripterygium wilfordii]